MNKISQDSVIEIYVNDKRQASGTVIGQGNVITSLHVISSLFEHKNYNEFDKKENPANLKIEVAYKGKRYPANIIRGNQHHDLCLLASKELKAKAIQVAPTSYILKEGDRVFSVGLPKGEIYSGAGKITRLDKIKSGEPSLVINDAPSKPGCSGGALLNEKGELIGMQGLNGASIPHAWINELLSRKDKKIVSRSNKPETEVDHYFGVTSFADSLKSPEKPLIDWVLERPESQFAAINFLRYNMDFRPDMVTNPDDYEKVLKTLEDNKPKFRSKCELMKCLSDIVPRGTIYREKYLLKALENTEDKKQQAELCLLLGRHHFYDIKNPKLAVEFFEKTISLAYGKKDMQDICCMAYENITISHLAIGDKAKAHQAFINLFEGMYNRFGKVFDYNCNAIFDKAVEDVKKGALGMPPLFAGDFEKQEIFRKCLNHVKKIYPSSPSGGII